MPGLASIPLLGKLFQSRSVSKTSSELLVMVTPELVYPLPAGAKVPEVHLPLPFPKDYPTSAPQTPVPSGGAPIPYKRDSVPIEELTTPAATPAAPAPTLPTLTLPSGASPSNPLPGTGQP